MHKKLKTFHIKIMKPSFGHNRYWSINDCTPKKEKNIGDKACFALFTN